MTREERDRLIDSLFAEKCSCVIRNGNETRIFRERGVKDLFRLLTEDRKFLDGAFIADKVVGKGAAALMVLGGIREVFADVISRPALDMLRGHGIKTGFTLEVPHIINRTRSGICPVEQLCADCTTAEECLARIEEFLKVAK